MNPVISDTVPIAFLPFLSIGIFQRVALYRENLMRTHQVPVRVDILLCQLPEQIRITDRRKYVVCLHTVVPIVGTQRQEFRKILVPRIQIYGDGSLAHAQLIYRHRGIIGQLDPADHAPGCALKAADCTSCCPDLAEIQPHTTAELADLGKAVNAAVNAIQAVRHRVDKTGGKLMIRLSRVGKGRRRHGNLKRTQHIVKAPHPFQPVVLLQHGQMQGDAQKHFLRGL